MPTTLETFLERAKVGGAKMISPLTPIEFKVQVLMHIEKFEKIILYFIRKA